MWEIFWGCGVSIIVFLVSVEGKLGGVKMVYNVVSGYKIFICCIW